MTRAVSAGRRLVAGTVVAAALLSGCASNPVKPAPPTVPPATAAAAPAPSTTPAGEIRKLGGSPQAAMVEKGSSDLLVLGGGAAADTLTVLTREPGVPRTINLPGPATALSQDAPGSALLATRGGYLHVDVAAGTVRRIDIDGEQNTDFTALARRADGTLVLGSADGTVFILASGTDGETAVAHREKLFARVDSIVTQGNTAVILDRGQTSVTAVDAEGNPAQALRAGEGATTMTVDPAGRVLVADTRGDELLVFGVDPLMLRQRYPVPEAPYGLAGSPRLAWVSQTAANTVIGYDLATGIPVEKVRYPTVQQPNLLAYDDASGALYVVSGSGAGVQVIENAGPR